MVPCTHSFGMWHFLCLDATSMPCESLDLSAIFMKREYRAPSILKDNPTSQEDFQRD